MIQYRYALDHEGTVIDISDLEKAKFIKSEFFKCIGCSEPLVPRLGDERAHHFAHKVEGNCSFESYLHKLAKTTFYNQYRHCLANDQPFKLRYFRNRTCTVLSDIYGQGCSYGIKEHSIDLTKTYNSIYLEKEVGNFRPDVLLESQEGKQLFIEIKYTHGLSDEKRGSSYQIVEYEILSEEDIDIIKTRMIESGRLISLINFPLDPIESDNCQGNCDYRLVNLTMVFKNGAAILKDQITYAEAFREIEQKEDSLSFVKCYKGPCSPSDLYKYAIARADLSGKKVKSCFLCEWHIEDRQGMYCKKWNQTIMGSKAITCSAFRSDPHYRDKYLKKYNQYELREIK